MFKKKIQQETKSRPKVEVIKVRQTTRQKIERRRGRSYQQNYDDYTEEQIDVTEVLCVVDGELRVKEYNGKWDLEDVRKGLE